MKRDQMELDEYGSLVPRNNPDEPQHNRFRAAFQQPSIITPEPAPIATEPSSSAPIGSQGLGFEASVDSVPAVSALERISDERERTKANHLQRRREKQIHMTYLTGIAVVLLGVAWSHVFFPTRPHSPQPTLAPTSIPKGLPVAVSTPQYKTQPSISHQPPRVSVKQQKHVLLTIKATPKSQSSKNPIELPHAQVTPLPVLLAESQTPVRISIRSKSSPMSSSLIIPAPEIVQFYAVPKAIYVGQNIEVCVRFSNIASAAVTNFPHRWSLNNNELSCRHTSPHKTTTFTAWAANRRGFKVHQHLKITVLQAAWMLPHIHRFEKSLNRFSPTQHSQ